MFEGLVSFLLEWYRAATWRELIATAVAIFSSGWSLIEIIVLKPIRRREHKRQISSLMQEIKKGRGHAEKAARDASNLQRYHMREMAALQSRHNEHVRSLRYQFDNLQYRSAMEAGRREQQFRQLHEVIRSAQLSIAQPPAPVAAVADTHVINQAVRKAEKATAELPVTIRNPAKAESSASLSAETLELDSPDQSDDANDPSLPKKSNIPAYLAYIPKAYAGLDLVREVAEVDDMLVNMAMDRLRDTLRGFSAKDGPAAIGDRITLTGTGFVSEAGNWVAFNGGKLAAFPIVIGRGMLIPGFEHQLVGLTKGCRAYIEVTFPVDYHAQELAGKPAVFQVSVDEVESATEMPFTDESVKPLGFASLAELRAVLWTGAKRDLEAASKQRLKRQVLDRLDENNKFEAPAYLVKNEHEALWRAQLEELRLRGLPMDALGKPEKEAKADLLPLADRRVRLGLVLSQLAAAASHDGMSISEDEVDSAVEQEVHAAGPNGEKVAAHLAIPANREALRMPLLEGKVIEWILSKAHIREVKVAANELLKELM